MLDGLMVERRKERSSLWL